MKVNKRIKQLRELNRYTIREIADKLNVSVATAQRYESDNGIKAIPYEIIEKYAKIFDVSPSYIMGWEKLENEDTPEIEKLIHVARNMENDQVKRLLAYFEYFQKHNI